MLQVTDLANIIMDNRCFQNLTWTCRLAGSRYCWDLPDVVKPRCSTPSPV